MDFNTETADLHADVMADLGTVAQLRHPSGREVSVSVMIDVEVQYVGEFGQVPERRTVASLDVADAGHARLGAMLVVPSGVYQGEYSLASLREGDGFVERFAMTSKTTRQSAGGVSA